MASVKIMIYKSKTYSDGSHPVLLRVIIDRKPVYYGVGGSSFNCLTEQWDEEASIFNNKFPNYKKSNRNLHSILGKAEAILCDLEDENPNFTHSDFKKLFQKKNRKIYLLKYFNEIISRLEDSGRIGNASVYSTTRNAFKKFLEEDIPLTDINQKVIALFIENCEKNGLKPNSISNYLRTLRAIFNRAKKEEGFEYNPFNGFNWSKFKNKTAKRAISKADMIKIINYECDPKSELFESRQFFAFMYLTYGLKFTDLAKIGRENIYEKDGEQILIYTRSKGGKLYQIPLSSKALEIINFFKSINKDSKYIFPILNENYHVTPKQIKTRIQTALKKFNANLGTIASKLELTCHITSYVSRHSFASILAKEGTNLWTIGEMLGHSDLRTTQIYLKELDYSDKIEASKKLID